MLLRQVQKKIISSSNCVTANEKWIYFENPKRKRSWVTPSKTATSTERANRYGWKTVLCVWQNQKGVIYYKLLKPGENVNTELYRQPMMDLNQALSEKRPEYQKTQHKVILLHDNALSRTTKPVKKMIEVFSLQILSHAAYSPDLTVSHRFSTLFCPPATLRIFFFLEPPPPFFFTHLRESETAIATIIFKRVITL